MPQRWISERYNVNLASALDFQIAYYMQYQLHKLFPSVLTMVGREVPEALPIQSRLLLQLFNMLKMLLQEIYSWVMTSLIWERHFVGV